MSNLEPVYLWTRLLLLFFNFLKLFNFIYDCTGSSLLHAGTLVVVSGLLSVAASLAVQHGLWDVPVQELWPRAELPRGMWNPPRPGTEPMSPALACGLPTTGPPGKPETRPF